MISSHRIRLLSLSAALVAALLVAAPPAAAQISTATVNGTVRDSTGAVIPGAEVSISNVETGVEQQAASNTAGVYRFSNLQPGLYTLSCASSGFQTAVVNPFSLVVNQTATFDFGLEVGAVTETVTVEASGAQLQASSAELGSAVTEKQVVDLPLNGRNFTKLLELTPGVAPVSVSQNRGGFTARPIGEFQFPAVNGQTNRSNLFMLDGVFNQGAFVSTYAVPPIIDTIQEFKVNAHNDDPEFGGAVGGIVNVVTKGGTNELHGNLWWFLRNDKLDSRNFFRPNVTPQKWNQFGGTLGGPIVRNKTFFMLGYQGFRLRRPSDRLLRVPTDANLAGNLSDDPRRIYDPFTTRPADGGGFVRDRFANNTIPASMLSPAALSWARAALPSAGAIITSDRNALDSTPVRQNQEEYTARLDHVFSETDSFWFRWSGTLQDNDVSGGLPTLGGFQEYRARNTAASWVHTFSPTTILQVQGGWVKSVDNAGNRFRDRGVLGQLGCASTFCGSFNSGEDLVPNYNVTSWFSGGESNTLNTPSSSIVNFRSNVTKVMGNHTIKFGGEGNTTDFQSFYENLNQAFRVQQTANPLDNDGGISLASFLLGTPDSAGRRNVWETLRPGGTMGFYVMDSWKASPRLTINLGLRYDRQFQPPYGEEKTVGKQGGIETGALDLLRGIYILQRVPPSCAERGFAPCIPTPDGSLPEHVTSDPRGKIYHDTTKNFQPRVGIAYRISDNTVLRTSYGIFFDEWAAVTQTAQNYEGGWPDVGQQLGNNLNQPTESAPLPTIDITNPFPQGLFPPPTPFTGVLWYMDPHFENPYSQQWNFGLQHQVDRSTVITANYVGSASSRLNVGGYYNTALEPGPGPIKPRTPHPHAQQSFFDRSWGKSNYHAFQFLLDKRLAGGLAYKVAYTWSRSMDHGSSGWYGVEGFAVQNPYNLRADYSPSGFDIPHVLTVNWIWQLPFGENRRWDPGSKAANAILGGWQFNGIALFRSGQPYTMCINGDITNTGNTGCYARPVVNGQVELSNPTTDRWINTGALDWPEFVPGSTIRQFGNSGRHNVRTDGVSNFDLSLFKQFRFSESRYVEFRLELFNAFNTPTFGTPSRVFNSSNFGAVTGTALRERNIQMGLKIAF